MVQIFICKTTKRKGFASRDLHVISRHSIRFTRPVLYGAMVRLVFLSVVLLEILSGISAFAEKVRVNDSFLHKILYHVAF